jgi:hypothetical protein
VPYELRFADTAIGHLAALTARERSTVINAIEDQLSHEPLLETRKRKLLRPNPIASWELRLGSIRVFYDVARPPSGTASVVRILAVGKKDRTVLRIGGKVVKLMKTMKLSDASRPLAEYARKLDDDIVLVTGRNRPIAAVVSLKNVDGEVLALSRNPQFLRIIEGARRDFAAGRSRSLAEVRDLLGLRARPNKRTPLTRKKRARS